MTDLAIVKQEAAPVNQDALATLDVVDNLTIASNEALQMAMKWAAAVKKEYKKAVTLKDSFLKPLKESVKAINDHFKPGLEALRGCEESLKVKAVMFVELATKRRDSLLAEVANSSYPEYLMREADTCIIEEMPGLSIREPYWTGEIEEDGEMTFIKWAAKEGNYAFLQPNIPFLKRHSKHLSVDPEWPGWKAYTERVIAITVDEIEG